MNIKPRLEKDIPKSYLYLTIRNSNLNEKRLNEIKSKKDKESMKEKEKYREYIKDAKDLHDKLTSGQVINLHSNKEIVSDFNRSSSNVNFDNEYVIKVKPICMFKEWRNYSHDRDRYELYTFTVDGIFYNQESLMKSLKKDGCLSGYILNTFLNLTFSNEEYIDIRNNFINYVINTYPDHRPSFAKILKRFKAKDYESSATYKVDNHKIRYYIEAYEKGFIKLNEEYETEATFVFLLKNRMFDLLKDAYAGLTEYGKEAVEEFGSTYKTYESVKCIKEELMKNLDNENCVWLYNLCSFKNPGYNLKIIIEQSWEDDEIVDDKIFEKVEDLKKYLIRNYDCGMDRVYNSKFDELYVRELDKIEGEWMEVKVEYVE